MYLTDDLTDEHYRIAEQNGISRKNVNQRYWDYGWEIEKAINEPINQRDLSVWHQWKETCLKNGISNECFNMRLKKEMSPEEAATMPKKWKKIAK